MLTMNLSRENSKKKGYNTFTIKKQYTNNKSTKNEETNNRKKTLGQCILLDVRNTICKIRRIFGNHKIRPGYKSQTTMQKLSDNIEEKI